MKLSHLTLSLLIAGASVASAQDGNKQIKNSTKEKKDTRILVKDKRVAAKDSVKVNKTKITPRNCGPCGMG